VTARGGARPRGFTWRGLAFDAPWPGDEVGGFYSSPRIELEERSADWKCQRLAATWHARLRIGADRFPGVGATAAAALDAAAAEAANVAALIATMLPPGGAPGGSKKRPRRTRKAGR